MPEVSTFSHKSDKTAAICNLLATGTNKLSDIADKAGSYPSLVKPVLENLEKLAIVEKEQSVSPAKRKPVWRIKDSLIEFWYLFRYPLSSYSPEIMMTLSNAYLGISLCLL